MSQVQFPIKSEYNAVYTAVMSLSHFIMLNNERMNNDPDVVQEQAPLIILDIKPVVCMANNGKDTKHTIYIDRKMIF